MFKLTITADSRVGCVRTNNEDMILVNDVFVRDGAASAQVSIDHVDRYLLALADGMGGHKKGEVASSDVLHNLQFFFNDIPSNMEPGAFNETIVEWLESVNIMLDSKGRVDSRYRGMGTTLVALAFYSGHYYWMNCGDSRIYRFRDGQLTQLSTDHSLSNIMGGDCRSGLITNCIGGGCKTSYIDMMQITSSIASSDVYLLCSDGLSDMLSNDEIERLLAEGADATSLCNAAEEAGGSDNVSVVVVHVE